MTTSDTIKSRIYEIKKQRSHLKIRLNVIKNIRRNTYSQTFEQDFFSDEEAQNWQRVLENLDDIDANFSDYVAHLDIELKKISKGLRTAAKVVDDEGRAALENYINEDISITVKNLKKARKEFDEAVEIMKQLKDMES